ncbi:hypothetical protein MAR_015516 [Mya arenaria]|uniref:C2 domain-containing protein n=1 Tax=Mya arenaria TaxID=6604 RepID=A0ABY7FJ06_MYAAR|nr:hypothetical protein MAR_015516 [Mya arenaria]
MDIFNKVVRTDSSQSDRQATHDNYNRKMSLNDNELRRVNERRRSSLLRLLCMKEEGAREDSDEYNSSIDTAPQNGSIDEMLDYSPKVTRSFTLSHNFRSTFETDSLRIPSTYGQIKVMFQFFNEKAALHVTLLKGSNVGCRETGSLRIYAQVCLMPGKQQQRCGEQVHGTTDPVFYEQFVFNAELGTLLDRWLRIKLYNTTSVFARRRPLGECSIPLYPYDLTAVTVIWKNLKKCKRQKPDDDFDFFPFEAAVAAEAQGKGSRRSGLRGLLCGIQKRTK